MALLADFGREVTLSSGLAWANSGGTGWVVPSVGVDLDFSTQGLPAFRLSLVRGALPFQGPDPFARLDITARCQVDLTTAVAELRGDYPQAVAVPQWPDQSQISLGELLMSPHDGNDLVLAGTRSARIIRDLSYDSGQAIAALLRTGANPLQFSGAAAFWGISPRVAGTVQLTSANLRALAGLLPNAATTRDALFAVLHDQLGNLGVAGSDGFSGDQYWFACATLADRIFDQCCTAVGHDPSGNPLVRLDLGPDAPAVWDLSVPYKTRRWLTLAHGNTPRFDTFLAQNGSDALISERVIGSFPRSHHELTVYSTFSASTVGLHALGVTAQAAANPPLRPAASTETSMITAERETADLRLKLALGEPLSYQLSTFAVGQTGQRMWQQHGAVQERTDYLIALGPSDFGIGIFEISATSDVLDAAQLTLKFDEVIHGIVTSQSIPLTLENQSVVLSSQATAEHCTIVAQETDGQGQVTLNMGPLASFHVTPEAFQNHGQQVAKIYQPIGNTLTIGLEVKPFLADDTEVQTFAFNDRTPERAFSYRSTSLFQAGFKYRMMGKTQWHCHDDPTEDLILDKAVLLVA